MRDELLGVIVGSTLSVNFDTVEGMNLTTGLTWPRDREGRVVSGILLPVLFLPASVLWRALTDSRGRLTLGRKLTRTEVMTLQSERPSLRVSLARQALNWGPLAIGMPPFVWVQLTASFPSAIGWSVIATWALAMVLMVPWIIGTIGLLQSDRDTIIDRWLGTTVVLRA